MTLCYVISNSYLCFILRRKEMNRFKVFLMLFVVAGIANATYLETFDSFTLGPWVDQHGWSQTVGADPARIIDSTIGYDVDGRAIRHDTSGQERGYKLIDGVNLGIDSTASAVQLSFDFLSEGWGISNADVRFTIEGGFLS
jgi:hypothetical protein